MPTPETENALESVVDHPFSASSTLAHAAHLEGPLPVLTVTFKSGSRYCYYGVPRAIFDGLVKADSAGKFFAAHIRDKFRGDKLPATPPEKGQR